MMFGTLLRVTAELRSWRDGSDVQSDDGYEYFSSNCCKVGKNDDAVVSRHFYTKMEHLMSLTALLGSKLK